LKAVRNLPRLIGIILFVVAVSGVWLINVRAFHQEKPMAPMATTDNSEKRSYPLYSDVQKLKIGFFDHDDHPTGEVRVYDTELIKNGKDKIKIDCAYCHLVNEDEGRLSGFGEFPYETSEYLKNPQMTSLGGKKRVKSLHSACTECHNFQLATGRAALTAGQGRMCAICHTRIPLSTEEAPATIHPYPRRSLETQFGAMYTHLHPSHKDILCETCHSVEAMKPEPDSKNLFSSRPEHRGCFVCHMENAIQKPAKPYATDCAGCHTREVTMERKLLRDPIYTTLTLSFEHNGVHATLNKQWDPNKYKEAGLLLRERRKLMKDQPADLSAKLTELQAKMDAIQTDTSCRGCHNRITDSKDKTYLVPPIKVDSKGPDGKPKDKELLRAEKAAAKIERDWRVQVKTRWAPNEPANLACGGCHGFSNNTKLIAFNPQKNSFVEVFTLASCELCHPPSVLKDATGAQVKTPESHLDPAKLKDKKDAK
jgi:predicted CXXCH cytochrome family protein